MNTLKAAAWNFWYTLSNSETKTVYQLAFTRTWNLLNQAVQLIMLLGLLLVMAAVWLWSVSFQGGRSLRNWLETENPTAPEVLAGGGQLILGSLKKSLDWLQTQLQTRYGLNFKFPDIPELKLLEETPSSGSNTSSNNPAASTSKTSNK